MIHHQFWNTLENPENPWTTCSILQPSGSQHILTLKLLNIIIARNVCLQIFCRPHYCPPHDHWSHCPGMTETMTLHDMSRHVTRDTSHMTDPIEDWRETSAGILTSLQKQRLLEAIFRLYQSFLAEVVAKRITIITITESWFLAEDANWLEARNPFSYNPNKTRTVQL